jgi:N-acetylglucosaminyldiphosphoundecaprenol N-acetyl-beta-D-mannosaminyltransferase
MFDHIGKINAVMIGVGAAFDYHAGLKRQAPRWMMAIGLEWFFRLCNEPRRLWRRYLYNNPRYLFLVARQILRERYPRN